MVLLVKHLYTYAWMRYEWMLLEISICGNGGICNEFTRLKRERNKPGRSPSRITPKIARKFHRSMNCTTGDMAYVNVIR